MTGPSGNHAPYLGGSKSHLVNITQGAFIPLITGNSKGFRISVPEMGTKTKYIFLIIYCNITGGEELNFPFYLPFLSF